LPKSRQSLKPDIGIPDIFQRVTLILFHSAVFCYGKDENLSTFSEEI